MVDDVLNLNITDPVITSYFEFGGSSHPSQPSNSESSGLELKRLKMKSIPVGLKLYFMGACTNYEKETSQYTQHRRLHSIWF